VLWIVPDAAADPGPATSAFGSLHAGVGLATNVDVNITRRATDTLPDAPAVANLPYKGIGRTSRARAITVLTSGVAADSMRVVVTAAGTKTPVLFSVKVPRGIAGTSTSNPIAGASVPGLGHYGGHRSGVGGRQHGAAGRGICPRRARCSWWISVRRIRFRLPSSRVSG